MKRSHYISILIDLQGRTITCGDSLHNKYYYPSIDDLIKAFPDELVIHLGLQEGSFRRERFLQDHDYSVQAPHLNDCSSTVPQALRNYCEGRAAKAGFNTHFGPLFRIIRALNYHRWSTDASSHGTFETFDIETRDRCEHYSQLVDTNLIKLSKARGKKVGFQLPPPPRPQSPSLSLPRESVHNRGTNIPPIHVEDDTQDQAETSKLHHERQTSTSSSVNLGEALEDAGEAESSISAASVKFEFKSLGSFTSEAIETQANVLRRSLSKASDSAFTRDNTTPIMDVDAFQSESFGILRRKLDAYFNPLGVQLVLRGNHPEDPESTAKRVKHVSAILTCDCFGQPKESTSKKNTTTKKTGCQMRINISCCRSTNAWTITSMESVHSGHTPKPPPDTSVYVTDVAQLSDELVDLTRSVAPFMKTNQIRAMLSDQTSKTVDKSVVTDLLRSQRSQFQSYQAWEMVEFLESQENVYYKHDSDTSTQELKGLVFVTSNQRSLYKQYNDLIFFDLTYNVTWFQLKLGFILCVDNNGDVRIAGTVLLTRERNEDMNWAFQTFLELIEGPPPSTIMTDMQFSVLNAVRSLFPQTTHLLCHLHVRDNLLSKSQPHLSADNARYADFSQDFFSLIAQVSHRAFEEMRDRLAEKYSTVWEQYVNPTYRNCWHMLARCFRVDRFTHGSDTNNISENAFMHFKQELDPRKKPTLLEVVKLAMSKECDQSLKAAKKASSPRVPMQSMAVQCKFVNVMEHVLPLFTNFVSNKVNKLFEKSILYEAEQVEEWNEVEELKEAFEQLSNLTGDHLKRISVYSVKNPRPARSDDDTDDIARYVFVNKQELCKFVCTCCTSVSRGYPCLHFWCVFLKDPAITTSALHFNPRFLKEHESEMLDIKFVNTLNSVDTISIASIAELCEKRSDSDEVNDFNTLDKRWAGDATVGLTSFQSILADLSAGAVQSFCQRVHSGNESMMKHSSDLERQSVIASMHARIAELDRSGLSLERLNRIQVVLETTVKMESSDSGSQPRRSIPSSPMTTCTTPRSESSHKRKRDAVDGNQQLHVTKESRIIDEKQVAASSAESLDESSEVEFANFKVPGARTAYVGNPSKTTKVTKKERKQMVRVARSLKDKDHAGQKKGNPKTIKQKKGRKNSNSRHTLPAPSDESEAESEETTQPIMKPKYTRTGKKFFESAHVCVGGDASESVETLGGAIKVDLCADDESTLIQQAARMPRRKSRTSK